MTMPTPKGFLTIQAGLLVLSIGLAVVSITDLVSNGGVSAWIGSVCWPIVAICSAWQLVRHRPSRPTPASPRIDGVTSHT